MSCDDIVGLLAVIGLVLELLALLAILGVGGWIRAFPRRFRWRWRRITYWLRRVLPWVTSPTEVASELKVRWGAEAGGVPPGEVIGKRPTDEPAPTNLEEVGGRFNRIAEDLNMLDQLAREKPEAVRTALTDRMNEVSKIQAERHADLDSRVKKETQNRFEEKRKEAAVFAVGVGFQLAGAVVLLFVC